MGENIVARILFIIGIAQMAIGVLVGLVLGNQYASLMNWSVFFTWAIGGFILGMLFIGFAENIRLLDAINKKTLPRDPWNSETRQEDDTKAAVSPEIHGVNEEGINRGSTASWRLEEEDRNEIKQFYVGHEISEIVPSPYEGYCLVKLKYEESFFVRVVDINGFGVQEVEDAELKHSIIKWYNEFE
ncbi:hypothetical protein ACFO3D_12310 [Virgibacillus kekensis]|uniref:Uncharacterized protein n=1 Tax=Virgibacillus kekensis TaxID=202261 RepID=A0ABV9DJF7_9BACI